MSRLVLILVALLLAPLSCSAAPAADKPDIIPFDPAKAEVKNLEGQWKVVDGDKWLLGFPEKEQAELALKIIRHYKMNQQCFVGKPARLLSYYLVDGQPPTGPCECEDAIAFNPARVEARKIDGQWKIVDGELWIHDFGASEDAAREAVEVIRKHGFTYICYVGRPKPGMIYFRKAGDAAAPVQADAGRLKVTVSEGGKGLAVRPVITVRSADEADRASTALMENPALFVLKPGAYTVTAHVGTGAESAPQRVEVKAGQAAEVTIGSGTGTLELTLTAGGKPWTLTCLIHLRRGDQLVAAESASPATFQAPAGTYLVRIALPTLQSFDIPDVAIAAGETCRKTVDVPAAQVTVKVTGGSYGGGKFPYVEILKGDKMVAALSDNPAKFLLLAGDYAAAIQENGKLVGRKEFTLRAGQPLTVELQAP